MKHTLLAAAASLALAGPAAVAVAQDTATTTHAVGHAHVMTDAQRGMYDTWPAERRTMYDAWPNDYKVYYWTLTPEQQGGWWVLNDDQRTRVYAMTPDQRTAAWASIMAQMNAAPAAASASAATSADVSMSSGTTTSGAMQFVKRETVQPVADSHDTAAAQSGDLPVCKKGQQDGCINGWEKNKTGTKPLSYWPGKPASEIPGKKPDPQ